MKKCIYCHKGIKDGSNLIAFYEKKTQFIFYFCSWWHVVRWYIAKLAKHRKEAHNASTNTERPLR